MRHHYAIIEYWLSPTVCSPPLNGRHYARLKFASPIPSPSPFIWTPCLPLLMPTLSFFVSATYAPGQSILTPRQVEYAAVITSFCLWCLHAAMISSLIYAAYVIVAAKTPMPFAAFVYLLRRPIYTRFDAIFAPTCLPDSPRHSSKLFNAATRLFVRRRWLMPPLFFNATTPRASPFTPRHRYWVTAMLLLIRLPRHAATMRQRAISDDFRAPSMKLPTPPVFRRRSFTMPPFSAAGALWIIVTISVVRTSHALPPHLLISISSSVVLFAHCDARSPPLRQPHYHTAILNFTPGTRVAPTPLLMSRCIRWQPPADAYAAIRQHIYLLRLPPTTPTFSFTPCWYAIPSRANRSIQQYRQGMVTAQVTARSHVNIG